MSAREQILARISKALNRSDCGRVFALADQPVEVAERLRARHRHTLPAVGQDLVQSAIDNMEAVLMSVVRLQTTADCVSAVQWYLQSNNIDVSQPGSVTVAPGLEGLDWPESYSSGAATGLEQVSITPCFAAVAETGSVVVTSTPETPTTLAFLPETHIIVVHESQLVRHVDDVFPLLRALPGDQPTAVRAVNFITGPSRTADIEQTLEIGAHGPRRTHVLLVSGQSDNY